MPKSFDHVSDSNAQRKSTRARKMKNSSMTDDLPDEVVNKVMKGAVEEVKMPPGWNPSDDSEDEYKPKKDAKKEGKKKRDDTSDSDMDVDAATPKSKRGRPPARGPMSSKSKNSPAPTKPALTPAPVKMMATHSKPAQEVVGGALVDQVHDCVVCRKKDGKHLNLGSGLSDLKYHYAVCYYDDNGVNRYLPYMDPGEVNQALNGGVLEEFGARFKYRCPFKDCTKNKSRMKQMGFKEFCIHSGVAHHLVERVMQEDVFAERPELEGVLAAIARDRGTVEVVEIPHVTAEEVHTCLICNGRDRQTGKEDKEAKHLSFSDNISRTRYHYASCLFDTGVYLAKYPPGPENTDENGGVRDNLGKEIKYSCKERGCGQKRMMGYKEFCIHSGNEHGGLEEIFKEHAREEVRGLGNRLKKKN